MRIIMWTVLSLVAVVSPVAAQSFVAPNNPTGRASDVSAVQPDGHTYTSAEWFDVPSSPQATIVFGGHNSSVDYFFTRALAAMNTGLGAGASWSLIDYHSLEGAFGLGTLEAWAENEPAFVIGDLPPSPAAIRPGQGGANFALAYQPTLNDLFIMGPNWHWVQLMYTNMPRNVLNNTSYDADNWFYTDTLTGLTYWIDSRAKVSGYPFYDTTYRADTTGLMDAPNEPFIRAGSLPRADEYFQFVTFVAWEGDLPQTFYLSYIGVGWGYEVYKN